MTRVEPRCNEPVSNEVIGFIVTPVTAKHMKKNLVIGNTFPHSLRYIEVPLYMPKCKIYFGYKKQKTNQCLIIS